MAATILLPAGFGALHAERLLLAEADGAEAVGRDAQRDEILLDGTGAAITEAEVIFGRPTLIAMTCDGCRGAGRTARTRGRDRVGGGVGGRDLGRALSGHCANFRLDGELRGIRGIPAQG